MPAGRPKKTLDDLPANWKELADENYSQGGSDVELRVEYDITHHTWDRLLKEEPEFLETIKTARQKCEAWWLKQGRDIRDKDLNATLWYMNMKNRFGWADKSESRFVDEEGKDREVVTVIERVVKAKDEAKS